MRRPIDVHLPVVQAKWCVVIACALIIYNSGCHKKDPIVVVTPPTGDLLSIAYQPVSYLIKKPSYFPEVPVPADNPMTMEGVQLGRRLFYDPILSGDSTQSCSSCHGIKGSFTDNLAVSKGIDGLFGRRSAMSLYNIAYAGNALFWDGRAKSLEDQAGKPVEDVKEMHNTWDQVLVRLKRHADYPARFRKAFGISDRSEITKDLATKAIAQFERILISSGTTKFDQFKLGNKDAFDDEETDGFAMFFDSGSLLGLPDAQCFHCHGTDALVEGNNFFNNGLDTATAFNWLHDVGKFEVSGLNSDKGKFRAPTLRNIAMSAPYMHDGRLKTLEEVLDMYSADHGKLSNIDPFIHQVGFPLGNGHYSGLNAYQKGAIIKFLKTTTDQAFVDNPDFANPFK
jgi:cytochrome c peroxidase